jgi:hypothetical protein
LRTEDSWFIVLNILDKSSALVWEATVNLIKIEESKG